jgi:DnaJ-class molecular chaperone
MADLYSLLNVPKTADAATIKRAYRKLAKELHPDRDTGNADRFGKVTAAYDILSDDKKRAAYDRGEIDSDGNPRMPGFDPRARTQSGARPDFGGGGFEFRGDPSDLFSELFGAARGRQSGAAGGFGFPPAKGADVQYRLRIPFTDAALARSVRLTLSSGKTIDLAIPKGAEDGQQLRLAGQGEAGPAGPGDAIVTLIIQPDPRFTRDGHDLRLDLAVPLETAVLGGKQRIETLDGEVMLTIAPVTTSGKVMRLKGKGWTLKDGSRGDLLARILVDVREDAALADFLRARMDKTA